MQSILYSFRRCPYAIRARLALEAAGVRPGPDLQLREVALKAKPPELLQISPKATVPVLVLSDGAVIEESLAVMRWALEHNDPRGWWHIWSAADQASIEALITENDIAFKHHLDRFKYPNRYPGESSEHHRRLALAILKGWNERLIDGGWLVGHRASLADWALLPFVRQFCLADPEGFDLSPGLEALKAWFARLQNAPELAGVMQAPWSERCAWRSPSWLYHLALRQEWNNARRDGNYRRSTRGQGLEEVGFIHLSFAHQVDATAQRFYSDVPLGELLVLSIDPLHLTDLGLEVLQEPALGSRELFPHLYGPLPLQAVRLAQPYCS